MEFSKHCKAVSNNTCSFPWTFSGSWSSRSNRKEQQKETRSGGIWIINSVFQKTLNSVTRWRFECQNDFLLHDEFEPLFFFVIQYSGARTRKKPSKPKSWRLTTEKEARTTPLLGYGTTGSSTLLTPGGFWASASPLRPSRFRKTQDTVYSGCE
jgi:hypothetical protein